MVNWLGLFELVRSLRLRRAETAAPTGWSGFKGEQAELLSVSVQELHTCTCNRLCGLEH